MNPINTLPDVQLRNTWVSEPSSTDSRMVRRTCRRVPTSRSDSSAAAPGGGGGFGGVPMRSGVYGNGLAAASRWHGSAATDPVVTLGRRLRRPFSASGAGRRSGRSDPAGVATARRP